jgi:two-component system chemotaxis response regulator CheY
MNKTVLIVDDFEGIRQVIGLTLSNAGYTVLSAINGKDALKHLDGNPISLVVTDLIMPELDGIGLIREIRKLPDYRYLPILLLTTESQAKRKEEAKAAGATAWITKPFMIDSFLSVVKKLIR